MAYFHNPSDANEYIDEIVRTLHTNKVLTVNEAVKGGSLGQGTAVLGEFDLDLVVYSSSQC